MAIPTLKLVSYVKSLKLTPWNGGLGDSGCNDAFVAGRAVVAFPPNYDPKLKSDVNDSMLFAQLAANADKDSVNDPIKWYNFYLNVLSGLGWATQDSELIRQDTKRYVSVDSLLLTLLKSNTSGAEFEVAKATVKALDDSKNTTAADKLNKFSLTTTKSANFQVLVAGEVSGAAVVNLGGYVYELEETICSVLFAKFGTRSVKFFSANQNVTLNDTVYSNVRESIRARLAPYETDLVVPIIL